LAGSNERWLGGPAPGPRRRLQYGWRLISLDLVHD
jgi:hypothetical protein